MRKCYNICYLSILLETKVRLSLQIDRLVVYLASFQQMAASGDYDSDNYRNGNMQNDEDMKDHSPMNQDRDR